MERDQKLKKNVLVGTYGKGGLKSDDVRLRIKSLQLSWIKRPYDNNNHAWKLIPKHLLRKHLGNEDIFYPNIELNTKITEEIPEFYKNIIELWCRISVTTPLTTESIFPQRIWYNHFIKVDEKTVL
jgi:hypothetical protein